MYILTNNTFICVWVCAVYNCSHGDMLFLAEKKTLDPSPPAERKSLDPSPSPSSSSPSSSLSPSLRFNKETIKVQEDEVDKLLATKDGLVHRKKDPQM